MPNGMELNEPKQHLQSDTLEMVVSSQQQEEQVNEPSVSIDMEMHPSTERDATKLSKLMKDSANVSEDDPNNNWNRSALSTRMITHASTAYSVSNTNAPGPDVLYDSNVPAEESTDSDVDGDGDDESSMDVGELKRFISPYQRTNVHSNGNDSLRKPKWKSSEDNNQISGATAATEMSTPCSSLNLSVNYGTSSSCRGSRSSDANGLLSPMPSALASSAQPQEQTLTPHPLRQHLEHKLQSQQKRMRAARSNQPLMSIPERALDTNASALHSSCESERDVPNPLSTSSSTSSVASRRRTANVTASDDSMSRPKLRVSVEGPAQPSLRGMSPHISNGIAIEDLGLTPMPRNNDSPVPSFTTPTTRTNGCTYSTIVYCSQKPFPWPSSPTSLSRASSADELDRALAKPATKPTPGQSLLDRLDKKVFDPTIQSPLAQRATVTPSSSLAQKRRIRSVSPGPRVDLIRSRRRRDYVLTRQSKSDDHLPSQSTRYQDFARERVKISTLVTQISKEQQENELLQQQDLEKRAREIRKIEELLQPPCNTTDRTVRTSNRTGLPSFTTRTDPSRTEWSTSEVDATTTSALSPTTPKGCSTVPMASTFPIAPPFATTPVRKTTVPLSPAIRKGQTNLKLTRPLTPPPVPHRMARMSNTSLTPPRPVHLQSKPQRSSFGKYFPAVPMISASKPESDSSSTSERTTSKHVTFQLWNSTYASSLQTTQNSRRHDAVPRNSRRSNLDNRKNSMGSIDYTDESSQLSVSRWTVSSGSSMDSSLSHLIPPSSRSRGRSASMGFGPTSSSGSGAKLVNGQGRRHSLCCSQPSYESTTDSFRKKNSGHDNLGISCNDKLVPTEKWKSFNPSGQSSSEGSGSSTVSTGSTANYDYINKALKHLSTHSTASDEVSLSPTTLKKHTIQESFAAKEKTAARDDRFAVTSTISCQSSIGHDTSIGNSPSTQLSFPPNMPIQLHEGIEARTNSLDRKGTNFDSSKGKVDVDGLPTTFQTVKSQEVASPNDETSLSPNCWSGEEALSQTQEKQASTTIDNDKSMTSLSTRSSTVLNQRRCVPVLSASLFESFGSIPSKSDASPKSPIRKNSIVCLKSLQDKNPKTVEPSSVPSSSSSETPQKKMGKGMDGTDSANHDESSQPNSMTDRVSRHNSAPESTTGTLHLPRPPKCLRSASSGSASTSGSASSSTSSNKDLDDPRNYVSGVSRRSRSRKRSTKRFSDDEIVKSLTPPSKLSTSRRRNSVSHYPQSASRLPVTTMRRQQIMDIVGQLPLEDEKEDEKGATKDAATTVSGGSRSSSTSRSQRRVTSNNNNPTYKSLQPYCLSPGGRKDILHPELQMRYVL